MGETEQLGARWIEAGTQAPGNGNDLRCCDQQEEHWQRHRYMRLQSGLAAIGKESRQQGKGYTQPQHDKDDRPVNGSAG